MSAQLAEHGVPVNRFTAHLALAAGVTVSIQAPTMTDLSAVVAKLQNAQPANDTAAPGKSKPAATPSPAPAASTAQAAAGSSPAPAAVSTASAGEAGNVSASTGTPAGAQPAASGSTSAGDWKYDDVRAHVLAATKVSRDTALGLLGKFTTADGAKVDHGNKLKTEDYPAFITAAKQALEGKQELLDAAYKSVQGAAK